MLVPLTMCYSSREARRDFVKILHNAIRESVRRMSLPGQKVQAKAKVSPIEQQSLNQQYIPYGGKRPESLSMRGSLTKKKGKQLKGDIVRHSMDVDDRVNPAPLEDTTDFRTRSQTLTDLNNMDLQYPNSQGGNGNGHGYPSGSQSTIASDSRNSAKLIQASNNPVNYSNQNVVQKDGLGSPIWKPRHAQKKVTVRSPSEGKTLESAVFSGSAYGDYSDVVYDNVNKHSMLLRHPNTYFEHEDTEC